MVRVDVRLRPSPDWDAFVAGQPGAALGHAAAWADVMQGTYGLEPSYLEARDPNGQLSGVLPLVSFRTLRGAREYVSLPFLDRAGILACSTHAERALLDAGLERVRESGAAALELRQGEPLAAHPDPPQSSRIDLVLPLERDEEAQWKAIGAKVRNQTRKAEREGLVLASSTAEQLLQGFYDPFCVNMRDLGSPVHARGFFAAAARAFGDRLRFVVTLLGDRPVGGLVAIDFAGTVSVPWASTLRSERARCPNNQIYWEALRWAIARGASSFDFGRSPPASGTHRFKLGWGAVEQPLAWLRLAPDGRPLAPPAEASALLERLSALWTRLPVPVASALGGRLRRYFSN